MSTIQDDLVERIAIEYHNFDGDEYSLKWKNCKSSYRGSVRKTVRTVVESAKRCGLVVLTKAEIDAVMKAAYPLSTADERKQMLRQVKGGGNASD